MNASPTEYLPFVTLYIVIFCVVLFRLKSGNPGYFVALNLDANQEKVADFSGIPGIGAELTVVLTSNNYAVSDVAIK